MKNKQLVEYSIKDSCYKTEALLYLDVENQHRQELTDFFGMLSENNSYKILTKRSLLFYLLSIIFFLLFLFAGLVYLRFAFPSQKPTETDSLSDMNRLLMTNQISVMFRRLQTVGNQTNSTVINQTESEELVDTLTTLESSVQKALDKLRKTNITISNKTEINETTTTINKTTTTNLTEKLPEKNDTNSSSVQINSTSIQDSANSTNITDNSTLNNSNGKNSTELNNPINKKDPKFDSNASALIILGLIGLLVLITVVIEVRRRQLFKNLIVFEETTLNNFHTKTNNKIILTKCHERSSLWLMDCFSVYEFKFLVCNNGTENESVNLNQQENVTNQSLEIQSESAIYQAIDEEGEKYHNAVLGLNTQLNKN